MNDQTLNQVSTITTNAVGMFQEYCNRNSAHKPELEVLQKAFERHAASLIMTIHISKSETIFECFAACGTGEPVKLFDVHELPVGGVH